MNKEVLYIQILGKSKTWLFIRLPISLVLNVIFVTLVCLGKLLSSIFNPIMLIATLVDIPIVYFNSFKDTFLIAITGKREVPESDFEYEQILALDDGESIHHNAYGECKLLEYRELNQENILVGKRLPTYLEEFENSGQS